MNDVRVQVCSPHEAEEIIQAMGGHSPFAFRVEGWLDAVCRNVEDATIAWELHQQNLVTDVGRRHFAGTGLRNTMNLFTSPSMEVPSIGRYGLLDDGNASSSQASVGTLAATYDALTLTKTFPYTFGAPAANRTIGTVGIGRRLPSGMFGIVAYTLITPVKVQSTTQTLELQYRLTLTPAF